MNAITPVTAEATNTLQVEGTDLLYVPGERIFAHSAPMMLERGWSIFPQERVGKRPGRTRNGAIQWGRLCEERASDEDMALWRKDCSQLNVACAFGPASGNAFALDIDCMEEAVSARVQAIAAEVLGLTRSGASDVRRKLPCSTATMLANRLAASPWSWTGWRAARWRCSARARA